MGGLYGAWAVKHVRAWGPAFVGFDEVFAGLQVCRGVDRMVYHLLCHLSYRQRALS